MTTPREADTADGPRTYPPAITKLMASERAARMDSPMWRLLDAVGALAARVEESGVRIISVDVYIGDGTHTPKVTYITPDALVVAHLLGLAPSATGPIYTWEGAAAGIRVTAHQYDVVTDVAS